MSDCSYPDANRRADELETLFNIQQVITRQLDIETVLQLIADEARRLTGSHRTVVFLLEGDTARIAVVSGEPHSKSVLGYRMPVAGSLISEAIQSQTLFLWPMPSTTRTCRPTPADRPCCNGSARSP